jgi:DNA-binding response OmpR family regulator
VRTGADTEPTVILVEDDEEKGAEIKQVLDLCGYRVLDADSGMEAARRAAETRPDLLLVDLNAPPSCGLVAARRVLKQACLGMVPVVVVTHGDADEPYPLDVGLKRNEYLATLDDYEQLEHLLDHLLPQGQHGS